MNLLINILCEMIVKNATHNINKQIKNFLHPKYE